jgi:hypothetical protein
MVRKALACLALPGLLAVTLMAYPAAPGQEPEPDAAVPLFPEPVPPAPAATRARAILLLGTRRPEGILSLYAATPNVEERTLATVGGTLVGEGLQGPYTTLATLTAVDRLGLTQLSEAPVPFDPDAQKPIEKAEPLLAHLLRGIKDSAPLPMQWNENLEERWSYNNVLVAAARTPAEAFRRGARPDLTYAHVMQEPAKYRGQVVHVQGTLKQLRRYDPEPQAKAAGVANIYEGWITDPRYGASPWCVAFTDLPSTVTPGDSIRYTVSFDGYLFKRFRYKARDTIKTTQWREAPLLIGRTLTVATAPPPETADNDWAGALVPIFLGLVASSIALAFGLGWWFRRGDRRVRERLAAVAERPFVEPKTGEN